LKIVNKMITEIINEWKTEMCIEHPLATPGLLIITSLAFEVNCINTLPDNYWSVEGTKYYSNLSFDEL
jgi:hypothetical protein